MAKPDRVEVLESKWRLELDFKSDGNLRQNLCRSVSFALQNFLQDGCRKMEYFFEQLLIFNRLQTLVGPGGSVVVDVVVLAETPHWLQMLFAKLLPIFGDRFQRHRHAEERLRRLAALPLAQELHQGLKSLDLQQRSQ